MIIQASGTSATPALTTTIPAVGNMIGDVELTAIQVGNVFTSFGKPDWNSRLAVGGSGGELKYTLDQSGIVNSKLLASWCVLY